eukprot:CAMPEP_0184697064 /NCGR_PEP_ID=MMETSP0313-20130426/4163_1 /TAXON_ID=2792 /ORGANISM="Porphyridium aerugineum, Strain SAG 1380-2" /LENGTH=290 /DNA_ID=CAMNT_0027155825 /DNA_START=295 /DNA_END=1167 /DNA_ORIENTATION=-
MEGIGPGAPSSGFGLRDEPTTNINSNTTNMDPVGTTNIPGSSYNRFGGTNATGGYGSTMYGGGGYSGYGSSIYGSGMYGGGYGGGMYGSGMYGGGMYRSPYSMYGSGMGMGMGMGMGGFGSTLQQGIMGPGGNVINGMHSIMHSFARVSGLLEELLRNFHMIFESVFGLFYCLGHFKEEVKNAFGFEFSWDKISIGPIIKRVLRRVFQLWRLFTLFILSPLAGKYSPVQILLRMLGLTPNSESSSSGTHATSSVVIEELNPNRNTGRNGSAAADELELETEFGRDSSSSL